MAGESSMAVTGGGITVAGWNGRVDDKEAKSGMTISSAKFTDMAGGIHVTTGPAATYWNPANVAKGSYTVRATFNEPKYMNLNSHPHPYGVVVGGNDLGSDQQSYLYCAVNGNGSFIVRGMGPAAFALNGGRGETNAAVNKAAAKGEPVTNEVAVKVAGDKVECAINGKTVASYDRSALVTAGRLKSTDGTYGLRFAHNTDVHVSGFSVTTP
ncbi:MAG: hypothetical protein H0W68_12390 [Gemmatimonadaceae bacterium]|nr:hypothetical protein [Gemmatimonadaceae bacterium]